jgi:hypothetical protein
MNPIRLEIVAPMLSTVDMSCRGCASIFGSLGLRSKYHHDCANEYPDDWKFAVAYLSEWIADLSRLYRHRIMIRIIDAQSPHGLWKQLRHRVFKFPAFIVDNKKTYIGWEYAELEALVDDSIKRQALSVR